MNFIILERTFDPGSVEYNLISVIFGLGFTSVLELLLDGIKGWELDEVGRVGLGGPTCFRGSVVPTIEVDGPATAGVVRGCRFAGTPVLFFFLGMNSDASDMVSLVVLVYGVLVVDKSRLSRLGM
jgi:hypothetical protein